MIRSIPLGFLILLITTAATAQVPLATFDFDDGQGGPDAQGWVPHARFSDGSTHFHVEDFSGAGHLAAVVDEHGDFTGIVTLADCLLALIGRVGDPGEGRPGALNLGPRRWLVDGGLDLRQFHEETGLELPPSRDYVTVAGFVMAELGRIAERGDRVAVADAEFTVVTMQGHRIETLRVARSQPEREVDA